MEEVDGEGNASEEEEGTTGKDALKGGKEED